MEAAGVPGVWTFVGAERGQPTVDERLEEARNKMAADELLDPIDGRVYCPQRGSV